MIQLYKYHLCYHARDGPSELRLRDLVKHPSVLIRTLSYEFVVYRGSSSVTVCGARMASLSEMSSSHIQRSL